jgi:nicotinate dehydrogenase subunit A
MIANWNRSREARKPSTARGPRAQNATSQYQGAASADALFQGETMSINLKVNGASHSVPAAPDTPLLYVLRNDLALNGAKYGCGLSQCGACTVLVDGRAVRSCVTPVSTVGNAEIITIEGIGTAEKPHPLQKAFIDEQAVQCGYCINGMIMSAKELLDRKPGASEADVRAALAANLCRCGTQNRIIGAVLRAAKEMGRS